MIRDRVRDEAIAVAKAYSHPQVELRHVLWGLVRVLDDEAPAEVPIATCKAFLEPAGQAYATPTVTAEAEADYSESLPSVLRQRPFFLPLFLNVMPHRFNHRFALVLFDAGVPVQARS